MEPTINAQMVTLARESRGYSQKELADKIGIAQGTMSKIEMGILVPDEKLLDQISRFLKYRKTLFFEKGYIYPPLSVQYRKKTSNIKMSEKKKIEALANFTTMNIQKLLKSVDFDAAKPISNISLEDQSLTPKDAARIVRMNWKLPRGPILNLTKILEDAGIIIVPLNFETDLIDGFRLNIDSEFNVVFVNKNLPGCRLRFTLAHELGHLVMHKIPTDLNKIEDEANEFAAEFLMPEDDISSYLGGRLDLARLADLKKYWKTSMQAILYSAKRISRITENQYKYLMIQMTKLGFRKHEPVDVPIESPTLLKSILHLHLGELGLSVEELSTKLNILEAEFGEIYFQKPNLTVMKNL